jgi:hypothetical protein
MNKKIFDLKLDPKGEIYNLLLDFAMEYCDKFFLVERFYPKFETNNGLNLIKNLEQFLLNTRESNEWPGTILFNDTAIIRVYKFNNESLSILKQAANGLYDWVHPDLLEDLCFLRKDGRPLLVTISHENDGYLELTDEEKTELVKRIPNVV